MPPGEEEDTANTKKPRRSVARRGFENTERSFARTPLRSFVRSFVRGAGGNRTLVRRAVTARATTIPGSRLYGCRTAGSEGLSPTAGSFPDVSGLSHRQRSLPAVLHRFCCRAAMDRPRVPSRVAMTVVT